MPEAAEAKVCQRVTEVEIGPQHNVTAHQTCCAVSQTPSNNSCDQRTGRALVGGRGDDGLMTTRAEKFTFVGSQGAELAARLDRPIHDPIGYALFAHCFTCSKDLIAASTISSALVGEGFGVLRFDFTGLGSRQGDFANTNFSSNVADLVAAADALRERYRGPDVLVGHSLGGAAVLAAGSGIPEVKAVATIAAPADPAHVTGLLTHGDIETIGVQG